MKMRHLTVSDSDRIIFLPKLKLDDIEQNAAKNVAEKLGYLPLALDQAGAYIHMQQYSFSQYLVQYESNASYLLSRRWKGEKHDRSVFATWEISFKVIEKENPKAAELLLVCGFFHNEDICKEFLRRGMKMEEYGMKFQEDF